MFPFTKLEATGNDFVVIDNVLLPLPTRQALCDRHKGVGGDGVLTVTRAPRSGAALAETPDGDRFRMHITNPDGSVPEMCGNGLRCVARHLAESGRIAVDHDVIVDTDAGPRTVRVTPELDAVTIDMGRAAFASLRQFPRALSRDPLHGFDRATTVSMGNPHVILEVDALPSLDDAARIGRLIELDAAVFPERTNVEWVVKRDATTVDVIVWERGAGLTQACGTGACGVVAALVKHGVVAPGTTTVHLPGGPLRITVADLEQPIFMTGPVRKTIVGVASP